MNKETLMNANYLISAPRKARVGRRDVWHQQGALITASETIKHMA